MASNDFCNSTGYWKDPTNNRDLTVDEPRVTTCKPGEKFAWPHVALADGNIVKLCSRLWNADEKKCYKEYRGITSKPRECNKVKKVKETEVEVEQAKEKPEPRVVKYDSDSATAKETIEILMSCDTMYGITFIAGITYALVGSKRSNVIYHIPRSCIPDEMFDSLCRLNNV